MPQPPKVFISYSHDSKEHQQFVLGLANCLRTEQGVDCQIDQHFLPGFPPQGWIKWMRDQVREADYVLVVCTPVYRERFERNAEEGGRGVGFEGVVISQTLYNDYSNNPKFIPVLPASGDHDHLPIDLQGYSSYQLPRDWQAVCDLVKGVKYNPLPPLGQSVQHNSLEARVDAYLEKLLRDNEERALRFASKVYAPLAGQYRKEHKRVAAACMSPRLRHQKRTRYDEPLDPAGEATGHDDVITAFKQHKRLVILGDPGAGKTFSLWRIAAEYAQQALEQGDQLLPVVIPLNRWDEPGLSLHDFVLAQLGELAGEFDDLYRAKRLLPLFDALNEIPFDQREGKLPQVKQWLEDYPTESVLITCRQRDYRGPLEQELDRLNIEPLDSPRIYDFLHNYFCEDDAERELAEQLFWQLAGGDGIRDEWEEWKSEGYESAWEDFWVPLVPPQWVDDTGGPKRWDGRRLKYLRDHRSLLKLAANPYLLTQMVVIYSEPPHKLPQIRIELFSEFVDDLIFREMKAKPENYYPKAHQQDLLAALKKLAWKLQSSNEFIDEVRTTLPRSKAEKAVSVECMEFAAAASLLELTKDSVRFSHQLMQEFFTAQSFGERRAEGLNASDLWLVDRWWEANGWEEAAKLAVEYEDDPRSFLNWLAAGQPKLAVEIAREQGLLADKAEVFGEFRKDWQKLIVNQANYPEAHERNAVSTVLAWLDWDEREGVGLNAAGLPDIDWVKIPPGEFIYGGVNEDDQRQILTLDGYCISRYSVTNDQFQAFMQADDGYQQVQWWEGLEKPDTPPGHCWNEANRPVETVDWYESVAFCRWLSAKTGLDIRLPTEQQWEKAARGSDGWEYPWEGDFDSERCNAENKLGETSVVGLYPNGQSSYGVMDMAGNVWEWCLNKHENPEMVAVDKSDDIRVNRGGSWDDTSVNCRCAVRYGYPPDDRDSFIGFRLVLV